MLRIVLAGAFALLTQAAFACDYVSPVGTLASVEDADYDFAFERGPDSIRCYVVRSPDQTTGVCEDGFEGELSRGTAPNGHDLVRFAGMVWVSECQPGFNLDGPEAEY